MLWLAIVFALGSALFAALSTSFQHQAAGFAPQSVGGIGPLLWHLTRRPSWLVGQALGVAGFAAHAMAVVHGPISLVQPIVITGIVFAVPIRSAMSRQLPNWHELRAVILTASALAIFLAASRPSEGGGHTAGPPLSLLVGGCAVLGLLLFAAGRMVHDRNAHASLLGAAAGLLLGLVAVLVKASEARYVAGGASHLFTSWPIWALACVGLAGVAINQVAYRSARLSASMPVLNVVNCLVALSFGYFVFQEVPRHTPFAIAAEVLGLGLLCLGLRLLANVEEDRLWIPDVPSGGALSPSTGEPSTGERDRCR